MKATISKWEREDGEKFLKKIGIKTGQVLLDFGARVGHYSIPAAYAVGSSGLVYAVDKDRRELVELKRKIKNLNLDNIKIVRTDGRLAFEFKDESIDVVLFYDVLHYFKRSERKKLYIETYRILKGNGLLSVYPKHVIDDFPLDHFKLVHWEDVKKEIQDLNFKFQKKYCDMISHDDFIAPGCVFNFIKG